MWLFLQQKSAHKHKTSQNHHMCYIDIFIICVRNKFCKFDSAQIVDPIQNYAKRQSIWELEIRKWEDSQQWTNLHSSWWPNQKTGSTHRAAFFHMGRGDPFLFSSLGLPRISLPEQKTGWPWSCGQKINCHYRYIMIYLSNYRYIYSKAWLFYVFRFYLILMLVPVL